MTSSYVDTLCKSPESLNAQDKERVFWHLAIQLGNQHQGRPMIFKLFNKAEVKERFDIDLSEKQWNYLSEYFMDFSEFIRDHIKWLIGETLYDLEKEDQ